MARAGTGLLRLRVWFATMFGLVVVVVSASPGASRPTFETALAAASPGTTADVVAYVNTRYREPLGLSPLIADDLLAKAATNHANYLSLNAAAYVGKDPLAAHNEFTDHPIGFTGVNVSDRCAFVGAPDAQSCGEVIGDRDGLLAVAQQLLTLPYHGAAFLTYDRIGCGLSNAAGVCDVSDYGGVPDLTDVKTVNTQQAGVRIWPPDGATDVPTSWSGGEAPDPLVAYEGNHNDIGPALYLFTIVPLSITLTDPTGKNIPLLLPGGTTASTTLSLTDVSPRNPAIGRPILVAAALASAKTYTLTLSLVGGAVHTLHFTTTASRPPASVSAPPSSPSLVLQVRGLSPKGRIGAGRLRTVTFEVVDPDTSTAASKYAYKGAHFVIHAAGPTGRCLTSPGERGCVTGARGTLGINESAPLDRMVWAKLPRHTLRQGTYWLLFVSRPGAAWTKKVTFTVSGV